ncbi:MAG: DUF86 domain-containing protein [Candidatus Cloacimonadaceae bacterium]
MKRNYIDYLNDILDAVHDILSFVKDMDFESFATDRKTQYAVIRCFEVIGEAAKSLPPSYRNKNPQLPWSKMAKMRDLLIHHYMGVDLSILWQTIKTDLTEIQKILEDIISD